MALRPWLELTVLIAEVTIGAVPVVALFTDAAGDKVIAAGRQAAVVTAAVGVVLIAVIALLKARVKDPIAAGDWDLDDAV